MISPCHCSASMPVCSSAEIVVVHSIFDRENLSHYQLTRGLVLGDEPFNQITFTICLGHHPVGSSMCVSCRTLNMQTIKWFMWLKMIFCTEVSARERWHGRIQVNETFHLKSINHYTKLGIKSNAYVCVPRVQAQIMGNNHLRASLSTFSGHCRFVRHISAELTYLQSPEKWKMAQDSRLIIRKLTT